MLFTTTVPGADNNYVTHICQLPIKIFFDFSISETPYPIQAP